MSQNISSSIITSLHSTCIVDWKAKKNQSQNQGFYQIVEENHSFNYQLWHAEDKARRDDMGFEFVYQAKREIDFLNQQRNNRMEIMDEWLFKSLEPASPNTCPVNSESPGMIIDRLSILALKSYHMDLQTKRQEVDNNHRTSCAQKLVIIQEQRAQLALCLEQLVDDIVAQTRTFRIYHQFKMYNDPNLNPELYY